MLKSTHLKRHIVILCLLILFCFFKANAQAYQFNNAFVLAGKKFIKKIFFIVNGIIFDQYVGKLDSLIDVEGKYIIPPFAEGHNHSLESAYGLQDRIRGFIQSGVFYAKIMSSFKKRIDPLLPFFNNQKSIDISYTYAPITATGGHPLKIREDAFKRGDYHGLVSSLSELDKQGYWIMDTEEQLNDLWDSFIASRPSFIKVMLLFSEEYEKRRNDSRYYGMKGLDPALLSVIVKKAHKNGIKVAVHVESATDFHYAVEAGVDEIAHLPGLNTPQLISLADIKVASKKKIAVTTTLSLIKREFDSTKRSLLIQNSIKNLRMLHENNVPILIGSDDYTDNSVGEYLLLRSLQVFPPEILLDYWVKTASYIFPGRKIGVIKNGFEGSFLVLDENPFTTALAVKAIFFSVKNGSFIKK